MKRIIGKSNINTMANNSPPKEYTNDCRVCGEHLTKLNKHYLLQEQDYSAKPDYTLTLEYITGLMVSVNDGLPQAICSGCRTQLRRYSRSKSDVERIGRCVREKIHDRICIRDKDCAIPLCEIGGKCTPVEVTQSPAKRAKEEPEEEKYKPMEVTLSHAKRAKEEPEEEKYKPIEVTVSHVKRAKEEPEEEKYKPLEVTQSHAKRAKEEPEEMQISLDIAQIPTEGNYADISPATVGVNLTDATPPSTSDCEPRAASTTGMTPGRASDVLISTKPKQFTVADGVRSTLYKALLGGMPDPDVLKIAEVYKDFSADIAPLIVTMAISADVPLVDSALGKVQEGSPISYQHPLTVSRAVIHHPDTPSPPLLPLDGYKLEPTSCHFVCSHQQHLHLQSLVTTLDMARKIEVSTREQSNIVEWHSVRRPRLPSSQLMEICHAFSPDENLAQRIRMGVVQTAAMKRKVALTPVAVQEYCRVKNANYWPCGFVIHPDAPWLGSSPVGQVFDPTESPPFGLLEIKCPNTKRYVDCCCLKMQHGKLELKQTHSYYWQVQCQLLLTGMQWCDFVVFAEEDFLIQRIYRDCEVATAIREKGDYFYFYFYMDV